MARILIVEDDTDLRVLYRILLERKGHEIIAAGSGEEALQVLTYDLVDAVVLDIRLPDIPGPQLIDEIKSLQHFTPVIINTGYDFLGEDWRKWGADAFVSKASGTGGLLRAVASIIPAELEKRNFEVISTSQVPI